MIIDKDLLDKVSEQAKASPRLRMNYNFHQSLDELCHLFLNAVEPGTEVPIHQHPTKDETFVILRGKVRVTTHRDDGSIIENVVLCAEDGRYGGSMGWGETMILGCHNKDGVIEEDTGLKR
jgi:cupin fold WbuC family metalloprotein